MMKKKLFLGLCLLALLSFWNVQAAPLSTKEKATTVEKRSVRCLVLSNTSHFEVMGPESLREIMEKFGNEIDYTFTNNIHKLKAEDLLEFDLIWIYNFGRWDLVDGQNGEIVSNLLGDYVAAGGYLLTCMYLDYNHPDKTVGLNTGRYVNEQMSPLEPTDIMTASQLNLGYVPDPTHPIMKDIRTITTSRVATFVTNARSDAKVVAYWKETKAPLVAIKGKIVALNLAPIDLGPDPLKGPGIYIYGDAFRLIHNGIKWLFSQKYDLSAPDGVVDFKALPTPKDSKFDIKFSWTNPSKTIDANTLSGIDSIQIYRNNKLLVSFKNNLVLGKEMNYTDVSVPEGSYEYKIVPYLGSKQGYPVKLNTYSGSDKPQKVRMINLYPQGNDGYLAWEAPIIGMRNGWIDTANLKYKIVRNPGNTKLEDNYRGIAYIDKTITKQEYYTYVITPHTGAGDGESATSNPMRLYTDGAIWMGRCDLTTCNTKFYDVAGPDQNYKDKEPSQIFTVRPQHPELGERSSVTFNYIDLPNRSLLVYDGPSTAAPLAVGPTITGVFNSPQVITASPSNTSGALTFIFTNQISSNVGKGWDADIHCITLKNNDLKAGNLVGDLFPSVNKTYTYKAEITNVGLNEQKGFTVKLFVGNLSNIVAVKTFADSLLLPGESKDIEFTHSFTYTGANTIGFIVEIASDDNTENNTSASYPVDVQSENIANFKYGEGKATTFLGPIVLLHKTSVTESVYYPSDISVSQGKIKAIRFYYDFSREIADHKLIVHMSETKGANLEYGWIDTAKMQKVFENTVTFHKGDNHVVIQFEKAYDYKGGYLVIRVESPVSQNYSMGERFKIQYDETNYFRQIMYYGHTPFNIAGPKSVNNPWLPQTGFIIDCEEAGHLSGVVKCKSIDIPLDSVKVTIKGIPYTIYTDTDGKYNFPGLNAGNYELTFSKFDYNDVKKTEISVSLKNRTIQDIEMESLSKVNLSGFISDPNDTPIEGAKISLTNKYASFSGISDTEGKYSIDGVYANKDFTLTASKDLYQILTSPFTMENKDSVLDLKLLPILVPALSVKAVAEDSSLNALISWDTPNNLTFKREVYDDGSWETGYSVGENREGWFGSIFFMPNAGYIQSIDVYGAPNPFVSAFEKDQRKVTLDIFDINRKLVHRSEPFRLPKGDWITIDLPFQSYTDVFYAMVHFSGPGQGHTVGADENGSYASADLNYYHDGFVWGLAHTFASRLPDFCFMIRANVLEKSGEKISLMPGVATPDYNRKPANTSLENLDFSSLVQVVSNTKNIEDKTATVKVSDPRSPAPDMKNYTAKFDVYRYKSTDKENIDKWEPLVSGEEIIEYTDNTWTTQAQGSYGYAVQAKYTSSLNADYTHSNLIHKAMYSKIDISITSNTPNVLVKDAVVELINIDKDPAHQYTSKCDENGKITFDKIWKGTYKIKISQLGFYNIDSIGFDFTTNESYSLSFQLKEELRTPYNLAIKKDNTKPTSWAFTWNESRKIEDGFESHTDFAQESAGKVGWTYRNINPVPSYGFSDVQYPKAGAPCAYLIFNPAQTSPPIPLAGVSPYRGKKYLATFASPAGKNDKWIISPRLNFTNEFTFSFYAKTYDAINGLERFMVGYSITGTNSEDFVWVQGNDFVNAATEWTAYSYTIPGQAKYVSLRNVSDAQFFFMVDEMFIGNEKDGPGNITGYKVFLDGKEVAKVTDKNYTFTDISDIKGRKAGVVSLYASGESEMREIAFESVANEKEELEATIGIYPNPAKDYISVEGLRDIQYIDIHNVYGAKLKQVDVTGSSVRISITELPKGTYILQMKGQNVMLAKRFIKQ